MAPYPSCLNLGTNARQLLWITPHKLTSIHHCQSSIVISSNFYHPNRCLLLMTSVTGFFSNSSAYCLTVCDLFSFGHITLHRKCSRAQLFNQTHCCLSCSRLISEHTTVPPRRASSNAKLRPIPSVAPVTNVAWTWFGFYVWAGPISWYILFPSASWPNISLLNNVGLNDVLVV